MCSQQERRRSSAASLAVPTGAPRSRAPTVDDIISAVVAEKVVPDVIEETRPLSAVPEESAHNTHRPPSPIGYGAAPGGDDLMAAVFGALDAKLAEEGRTPLQSPVRYDEPPVLHTYEVPPAVEVTVTTTTVYDAVPGDEHHHVHDKENEIDLEAVLGHVAVHETVKAVVEEERAVDVRYSSFQLGNTVGRSVCRLTTV